MVNVTLYDGTAVLGLVFFNQPWIANTYPEGAEVAASGTVIRYGKSMQLQNFEVELLRSDEHDLVHTGRITPIHPAAEGISPRTIRELIWRALERLPRLPDPVPPGVIEAESFISLDRAVRGIHFPQDDAELSAARARLTFDELFMLELGVAFRKHRVESEQQGVAHDSAGPLTTRLEETLPFAPPAPRSAPWPRWAAPWPPPTR